MNIPEVLKLIRPGSQWTLRGETMADLTWHDTSTTVPTDDEMAAGQIALDNLSYRALRAAEYPLIGDQLDALWKGGDAAAAMLAQVQAVKEKYPKPQ